MKVIERTPGLVKGTSAVALLVLAACGSQATAATARTSPALLMRETFEDAALTTRGWYDIPDTGLTTFSTVEHPAGSTRSLEARFVARQTNPVPYVGGRHAFTRSESVDRHNVLFRTGAHPDMRFNPFLMAPYIGDGSPVSQTMWIDDITLMTGRPAK
jgi:hypothetical protein